MLQAEGHHFALLEHWCPFDSIAFQGGVSLCPTGVGPFCYGQIAWDDGPSDSPSLLVKQPPGYFNLSKGLVVLIVRALLNDVLDAWSIVSTWTNICFF